MASEQGRGREKALHVKVENISKAFTTKGETLEALRAIDLELHDEEFVLITISRPSGGSGAVVLRSLDPSLASGNGPSRGRHIAA